MLFPIRQAPHLLGAVLAALTPALVPLPAPAAPAPAASVGALLNALPLWSSTTSFETSVGYKDNLLLSYANEERSAFVRGGVETVLLRIPTGALDYSFYAQADRTQFLSGETLDHEAQAWVISDLGCRFGDAVRVSLPLTGYFMDRVIDNSDTELERIVAKLKETGGMVGPTLRWNVHPAWWIEAQAVGQRRTYQDQAFNSNVGEGTLRLAWLPRPGLEVRVTGTQRWRNYADRAQFSAAGRELAGTQLKISEREAELRFDAKWDEAGHWRTTTRVSGSYYRDNGSGYFSYRELKAAQDFEWRRDPWLVRLSGLARRIDFDVQTVGFGIRPPARLRDDYSAELRIERKLAARWTILANYNWERSRSNDRFASYVMNEGLLGLRWSWEK